MGIRRRKARQDTREAEEVEQDTAEGYGRVSTDEQAREGVSLDVQEERIRSYCAAVGLTLTRFHREEGVSGGKELAVRPLGRALVESAEAGKVRHVVALKLDRLFRDAADCLNQTKSWDKAGVALHVVRPRVAPVGKYSRCELFSVTARQMLAM